VCDPILALDVDMAIAARARGVRAAGLRDILAGEDPFWAAVLFLLGD